MANKPEYVELGLACANVCKVLERGLNGKKLDDLSQSVREAIDQLTTWVKSAIYGLDGSLTVPLIAELWRRSEGRSPNRANETQSPDLFMQGMAKKRSRLGSQTLTGSSRSSLCVQVFLLGCANRPLSGRINPEHPRSRF